MRRLSNCACWAARRSASACASALRCSIWRAQRLGLVAARESRRMAKRARSSLPPASASAMSSSSARISSVQRASASRSRFSSSRTASSRARFRLSSISASRTYCLSSSERSSSDSMTPCASALSSRVDAVEQSLRRRPWRVLAEGRGVDAECRWAAHRCVPASTGHSGCCAHFFAPARRASTAWRAGRLAELVLPLRLIGALEGAGHLGFELVGAVELLGDRG